MQMVNIYPVSGLLCLKVLWRNQQGGSEMCGHGGIDGHIYKVRNIFSV